MRRCLALALLVLLAGCSEPPLYTALSEQQANEMYAALLDAGVAAGKRPGDGADQWSVTVPPAQVPTAMAVLRANGMPRSAARSMGDIFRKEGFVSSPLEERARFLHALSQELSYTLSQIDGVVDARVHIALPDKEALSPNTESASASVVVVQRAGTDLSTRETDIKAIVTDGVPDLRDINRVTVKFFTRKGGEAAALADAAHAPRSLGAGALVLLPLLAVAGGAGWYFYRRRRAQ